MSIHAKDGHVHITLTRDQFNVLVRMLEYVLDVVNFGKEQEWGKFEPVIEDILAESVIHELRPEGAD